MYNWHLKFNLSKTELLVSHLLPSPWKGHTQCAQRFSSSQYMATPLSRVSLDSSLPHPTSHPSVSLVGSFSIIYPDSACSSPVRLVRHPHLLGWHECPDWAPCFFLCACAGYSHPSSQRDLRYQYNVNRRRRIPLSVQPLLQRLILHRAEASSPAWSACPYFFRAKLALLCPLIRRDVLLPFAPLHLLCRLPGLPHPHVSWRRLPHHF